MTGRSVHATAVAMAGQGLLLLGPSGSGKSALAADLICRGARLVADDRVLLTQHNDTLIAEAPPALHGLLEVRGVGIVRMPATGPTPVHLVADLGRAPTGRLPEELTWTEQGITLPRLDLLDVPNVPNVLELLLRKDVQRIAPVEGGDAYAEP
ncbi:MAG: HPr kinase/phosphatase C-terminal domain-containing protein [Pseudomonadota bacterium]